VHVAGTQYWFLQQEKPLGQVIAPQVAPASATVPLSWLWQHAVQVVA